MALRLGLPKGSLQESTIQLFERAGFRITMTRRSYFPMIDDEDIEIVLMRAQEIPRYVHEGVLDAGLSGKDWIMENEADVVEVADLVYAKQTNRPVRVVIAVPNDGDIKTVQDLQGKRIATEYINLTSNYLQANGVKASIEYSYGATEAKVPELVDAIVDLTETGSSLVAHNLRIMDTILESTTKLHANKRSWEDHNKRAKLQDLAVLLLGVLRADARVGLKMNLPRERLNEVLDVIPAMKHPTLAPLYDQNWVALEAIVEKRKVRDLIPALKRAGAQDIIEYRLNKVIP